ncbi:hypothetical protein FB567DRAFT_529854 [Paraphoma chrysanthemicola]|uniref:Uncharacterized protein n=1 Tax=Paraphoma chrysanthemicola TaxID=798071 RepID=A0A8K0R2E4_9PLEO|nr:hypothetical protein FB567DRAFT_529854 [Paraphoma chrysanthemicola]
MIGLSHPLIWLVAGLPLAALSQGNSKCAQWCAANFPSPGKDCTSLAAKGGGPCYDCGPLSTNSNKQLCHLVCINTATDPKNCGKCDNQISSGETCCAGKAVNLLTDPLNCGACGVAVPSGQTCCGGKVVNTNTDGDNCGSCGAKCPANNRCSAGACTPSNCQGRGPIPRCSTITCPDAAPGAFCNCVQKASGVNICQSGWAGFCQEPCTKDSDCTGLAICARASCCPTKNGNDFFCTTPSGNAQCPNPAGRLARMMVKRDPTIKTEIRNGVLVSVLEQ